MIPLCVHGSFVLKPHRMAVRQQSIAHIAIGGAVFLTTSAVNLQLPLYARYAATAHVGQGAMTLALAGYGSTLIVVLLALGGVSDRLGRFPVLLTATLSSLAATLIVWAWPTLGALALARPLQGLGVGLSLAAGTAWLSEALDTDGPRRAATTTAIASTAGFGAGGLLTTAALRTDATLTPWSFPVTAILLSLSAAALTRLERPERNLSAGIARLPTFPPGSWIPAISIGTAWGVAGVVVAVLPQALARLGLGAWDTTALSLMLLAGGLTQVHARRVDGLHCLRIAAVSLPIGTLLVTAGLHQGSIALICVGTFVLGTATHGYGYVGGLSTVSQRATLTTRARAVSGYFFCAYIGFTVPAVAVGYLSDRFTGVTAFGWLSAAVLLGSAVVLSAARRDRS